MLPGDLVKFEVGAAFILNKQQRHFLFARSGGGKLPSIELLLGPALDDEDIGGFTGGQPQPCGQGVLMRRCVPVPKVCNHSAIALLALVAEGSQDLLPTLIVRDYIHTVDHGVCAVGNGMEIMVEGPTEFTVGGGGLVALVALPPSKGRIIAQLQA